jgi:PBP1b-binding outer membrane lipoprotein LpoB
MKRIVLIAVAVLIVAACGQPSSKNEVSVNPSEYTSKNQDNMQRVRDFLHAAGVYFLATVDGDAPLHV